MALLTLPNPRTPDPFAAPVVRWGILGTGWIADRFVHALQTHTRQIVQAVGSRTEAGAAAAAARWGVGTAYGSYAALVADPDVDIVYIATPHNHHLPDALLAIRAGKHVLVEKPVAMTADEGRQMWAAAQDAGVLCLEAMWTAFLPKFDVLRQVLDGGAEAGIGRVLSVRADQGIDPKHGDGETLQAFAPRRRGLFTTASEHREQHEKPHGMAGILGQTNRRRRPWTALIPRKLERLPAARVRGQIVAQRRSIRFERFNVVDRHIPVPRARPLKRSRRSRFPNREIRQSLGDGRCLPSGAVVVLNSRVPGERLQLRLTRHRPHHKAPERLAAHPALRRVQRGHRMKHLHRAQDRNVQLVHLFPRQVLGPIPRLPRFPAAQKGEKRQGQNHPRTDHREQTKAPAPRRWTSTCSRAAGS